MRLNLKLTDYKNTLENLVYNLVFLTYDYSNLIQDRFCMRFDTD